METKLLHTETVKSLHRISIASLVLVLLVGCSISLPRSQRTSPADDAAVLSPIPAEGIALDTALKRLEDATSEIIVQLERVPGQETLDNGDELNLEALRQFRKAYDRVRPDLRTNGSEVLVKAVDKHLGQCELVLQAISIGVDPRSSSSERRKQIQTVQDLLKVRQKTGEYDGKTHGKVKEAVESCLLQLKSLVPRIETQVISPSPTSTPSPVQPPGSSGPTKAPVTPSAPDPEPGLSIGQVAFYVLCVVMAVVMALGAVMALQLFNVPLPSNILAWISNFSRRQRPPQRSSLGAEGRSLPGVLPHPNQEQADPSGRPVTIVPPPPIDLPELPATILSSANMGANQWENWIQLYNDYDKQVSGAVTQDFDKYASELEETVESLNRKLPEDRHEFEMFGRNKGSFWFIHRGQKGWVFPKLNNIRRPSYLRQIQVIFEVEHHPRLGADEYIELKQPARVTLTESQKWTLIDRGVLMIHDVAIQEQESQSMETTWTPPNRNDPPQDIEDSKPLTSNQKTAQTWQALNPDLAPSGNSNDPAQIQARLSNRIEELEKQLYESAQRANPDKTVDELLERIEMLESKLRSRRERRKPFQELVDRIELLETQLQQMEQQDDDDASAPP